MTLLLNGALGLLPVLAFLATLVRSDTFKLVRLRFVLMLIAGGAAAAFAAWLAGRELIEALGMERGGFERFYGPLIEEVLKAAIIILLIRLNRIGFALDAAIAGFSVGAGFALVENYLYLQVIGLDHPAVWMIRGFGTAIMHGGSTAIFAVLAHLLTPQEGSGTFLRFFPGFAAALLLHAAFNQFLDYPVSSTIAMFVGLAAALGLVFQRDTKSIDRWLSVDFDAHKRLLEEIRSGEFGEHAVGRLLENLHARLDAHDVAEIVRYVELHTELVLSAEEILKGRERGDRVEITPPLKEKLARFHEAEEEVGRAVRLALGRHLHFTRHEFFEIYMLERDAAGADMRL